MHKDVETLLEVQALEQRLKELDAEISSLPRRLAVIESRLTAQQNDLSRAQAGLAANQAERRKVDGQIQDLKAKIAKSRGHSGDVKTNQEYKAVLDEIAFAEAEVAKCEERVLQLMEESEKHEAAIRAAEQALAAAQGQVEEEKGAVQQRSEADQSERQRIAARRERQRATVEAETLRRYDRVARLRGQGVAELDQEACGCCRVRLRPQFLQEIMSRSERVFSCESCGRLLYVPSAAEVEPVAAAGAVNLA